MFVLGRHLAQFRHFVVVRIGDNLPPPDPYRPGAMCNVIGQHALTRSRWADNGRFYLPRGVVLEPVDQEFQRIFRLFDYQRAQHSLKKVKNVIALGIDCETGRNL